MSDVVYVMVPAAMTGKVKLDPAKVKEIREDYSQGLLMREIAKKFEVSIPTVSNIINRKAWAFVD